LYFLYFFGLDRVGMLGPDEPRYAAISRAMANSGDWVTPRLWGVPWFEKPALLYWMTAIAFRTGLNEDLAPRLPVALASVAFLMFFWWVLRREFGDRAAFFSTVILGTSAGWLAYSRIGVPDLPMSVGFSGCMLILMRTTQAGRPVPHRLAAGMLLGLAVMAKGLVPLALFVPAVWWMRQRIRSLGLVLATAFVIAAPWYGLVAARNGSAFIDEFFWKQHFARIASPGLMHVRPFWFYLPVLLAALFPWSPAVIVLFRGTSLYKDPRIRFFLAWFAWGFVLFSIALNKLPGYLLPLLPAVAGLVGIAMSEVWKSSRIIAIALAASAALLACLPAVQSLLPQTLVAGLSHAKPDFPTGFVFPALLLAAACAALELAGRRGIAVSILAIGVTGAAVGFVFQSYPVLDRTASSRFYWKSRADSVTCVPTENRSWRYGLSYYAGRNLPDCN
jgi:4-amino-4-deoxy-L-arabinose transferase-like glycosyltransferase